MFVNRLLCGLFTGLLALTIVLLPSSGLAQVKEFIAEDTYMMGAGETASVAEERAIIAAKCTAIEQVGTYLESFTQVKNRKLSNEELRTLASDLAETMILDKKRIVLNPNATQFWAKVRCSFDTDDIQPMLSSLQDKAGINPRRNILADYDKIQQEITDLKPQLAKAATFQEKQQLKAKIAQNEQAFMAVQRFLEGYDAEVNHKDYEHAIFAYSQAIELNPQAAYAYTNRGNIYSDKGQYELAISDYTKAIKLNPQEAPPYYNRGNAYLKNEQYDLAGSDYSQAIARNPHYAEAYNNRGYSYQAKGQSDLAISEYTAAIQSNPQYAEAYYNRGNVYLNKEQYELAIADYNTALQLNSQNANVYYNKAFAYEKLGQNPAAIQAYKRFLQYAPATDSDFEKANQRIQELGGTI